MTNNNFCLQAKLHEEWLINFVFVSKKSYYSNTHKVNIILFLLQYQRVHLKLLLTICPFGQKLNLEEYHSHQSYFKSSILIWKWIQAKMQWSNSKICKFYLDVRKEEKLMLWFCHPQLQSNFQIVTEIPADFKGLLPKKFRRTKQPDFVNIFKVISVLFRDIYAVPIL